MLISYQNLIAFLPLLIIGLTIVLLLLHIAWKRYTSCVVITSISGLSIALLLAWFVLYHVKKIIDITPLIRIDNISILYTLFIITVAITSCIQAYTWIKHSGIRQSEEFYLLILIATLGGVFLVNANHLVSLFIGIELLSLPLFGLIGYHPQKDRSLEASIKYTLLSVVSSSFMLFGIALIYLDTGHLSFSGISREVIVLHSPLLLIGVGLMMVCVGFKLSWVPFHFWTPDVYQCTSTPALTFLSIASKIAIFIGLFRFFLYSSLYEIEMLRLLLSIITFISIIIGNIMAFKQTNIKRLLGYSSIAHFGYLLIGLIAAMKIPKLDTLAFEAISIYVISYIFSNVGIFSILILLLELPMKEKDRIDTYKGLFWKYPRVTILLTVMLLSLSGIPMTLGFIGKVYTIIIGIHAGLWWLVGSLIVGSLISLLYYLRLIIILYLRDNTQLGKNNIITLPSYTINGFTVILCAFFIIIFGCYPQSLIDFIHGII
ncbi:NADH-quinone oxidoreductase subunit N [Candidatus Schneideria nysicola]|uniref:NADH-quinone oxidoreductase subunit N n=1 Tax=Candidatus Schneideria nysicola TaxID=1081631 RepID=UPI001CAA49F5|nr:NADH-quinone oxidoreductase subunit N [Candidatus Schneideria nysicola]UAJ65517.1 NADH-quinone oxidoreductase subunit N [Candidatus Schneideria nysicola]